MERLQKLDETECEGRLTVDVIILLMLECIAEQHPGQFITGYPLKFSVLSL